MTHSGTIPVVYFACFLLSGYCLCAEIGDNPTAAAVPLA